MTAPPMSFETLKGLIRSDAHRVAGHSSPGEIVNLLRWNPGFNYCFWMRLCAYCERRSGGGWRVFARGLRGVVFRRSVRFGIEIPPQTKIGPGLFIGHFGGIVVHPDTVIGRNCNLSQGVTIRISNRGARVGCPVIGDNVYLAPNAKVFGRIRVGNGAAVGANAVVLRDVPDNAVVADVPARVVSSSGSAGYVNRTDYPAVEGWRE